MFTLEAGGPVSGRSGVKLCISLWLYVVLIYWRKVVWAIHKQVWLIYYPTPSATNYPGRLRPPVYCSALICHSAHICRLASSIVPGRLRRFLRAHLANCVGRQTALNIYICIAQSPGEHVINCNNVYLWSSSDHVCGRSVKQCISTSNRRNPCWQIDKQV